MAITAPFVSKTYEASDNEAIARVRVFLDTQTTAGNDHDDQRYVLAGAAGEQVELPDEVFCLLRQAVDALQHGLSVTVLPHSRILTTQQAADLLGVSRPTVIKLLESGGLPFERVGSHRKILLADLMAFRDRRRHEQYAALDALSMDLDDGETPLDDVLDDLRNARRAVSARRSQSSD